MKGLAAILGAKVPKAPTSEPAMKAAASVGKPKGSEMEFFKLASEASAAGDHEAAASALRSGVKACMSSYEASEPDEME